MLGTMVFSPASSRLRNPPTASILS
jgi:hypothetical protein